MTQIVRSVIWLKEEEILDIVEQYPKNIFQTIGNDENAASHWNTFEHLWFFLMHL